jgi:hypothetical protein
MSEATNMWKKMCTNLLKMSRKTSNFAEAVQSERQAYSNLIRQQSVLLDEYEDLVKAYEESSQDADSVANPPAVHPDATSGDTTGVDDKRS